MKNFAMPTFIQSLFVKIFDFVFPPTSSELILREANSQILKTLYNPRQKDGIIYLSNYHHQLIQTAVTANKFANHPGASKILAELLDLWIVEQPTPSLFIPIPLSQSRLRERGHNQVETILHASKLDLNIKINLLKRVRDTTPQTNLTKSAREKNLIDAFVTTENIKSLPENLQLVLVDDVMTTGTTLKEAKQALSASLPTNTKIICLALAH